MDIFLIGIFGAAGAVARYLIDRLLLTEGSFPVSTFAINLAGSFLIGVLYALGHERELLSPQMRLALATGLLGGFTTFSAYSLQVTLLADNEKLSAALFYFVLSPVVGVAAAWLGLISVRHYV
ncbi:MAG: fluoride efflux transporter CrcB [Bdellovibrionia bacterium]